MKSDLPFGKYYVKEIATDEHYILSDTKYPVVFEYAGQDTATVEIKVNDGKEKLPSFAEVVVISAVSFVNSVSSALKIPITAPSSASPFSSIFLPDTEP